jgi:hypothetical protein
MSVLQRALGATLALTLATPALHAQASAAAAPPNARTCGDTSLHLRVPVFLIARMIHPGGQETPASVANLLQAIADRADTILHAPPGKAPPGEPVYTDANIHRPLFVTWHRDGRLTRRIGEDAWRPESNSDSTGALLIDHALTMAQRAGEVYMMWPDTVKRDSLEFRLGLEHASVDTSRTPGRFAERYAIPLFSVDALMETDVAVVHMPVPRYPAWSQRDAVSGRVMMRFMVDTTGRVDMTTVRDEWASDLPRPSGQKAVYYREFLRAARDALAEARYKPATRGGCKFRQQAFAPFTFTIGS